MKPKLFVVDDFLANAEAIRERALTNDFWSQSYRGGNYAGVGLAHQPDAVNEISKAVNFPIEPVLSFYRLGLATDDADHWIHADAVPAQWSGVYYLNPQRSCYGGTAFWTHKERGLDSLTDSSQFHALNEEGKDESLWVMNGLVSMRFNRFIAYPSNLFHSRYPLTKWGCSKESGRLVWVVFFNQKGTR